MAAVIVVEAAAIGGVVFLDDGFVDQERPNIVDASPFAPRLKRIVTVSRIRLPVLYTPPPLLLRPAPLASPLKSRMLVRVTTRPLATYTTRPASWGCRVARPSPLPGNPAFHKPSMVISLLMNRFWVVGLPETVWVLTP